MDVEMFRDWVTISPRIVNPRLLYRLVRLMPARDAEHSASMHWNKALRPSFASSGGRTGASVRGERRGNRSETITTPEIVGFMGIASEIYCEGHRDTKSFAAC